jgi:hypothetical protein
LNVFFWSFIGVWKRWLNYMFNMKRLKMYFGQCFHTPMKLQKNAFNSSDWYDIWLINWPLGYLINQSYCRDALSTTVTSTTYIHLRIECILLKFHWGMKALTEVHFQALHVEHVVQSIINDISRIIVIGLLMRGHKYHSSRYISGISGLLTIKYKIQYYWNKRSGPYWI